MSQESLTCPPLLSEIVMGSTPSRPDLTDDSVPHHSLKRRASSAFEVTDAESSRKRMKEDIEPSSSQEASSSSTVIDGGAFIEDLEQELECGCCSALVYRPVIVYPCQHFFCGSCCVLWIRNGGTNCPACRGISSSVTPSRALQSMLDLLLRFAPHRARSERERLQADEVYKAGSMRIPAPREPSPEPTIHQNSDYARPCPHCIPGNPFGWRCPNPIPDPVSDPDNAWHLDDGNPPGHAYCGNCETLLALHAPTTTKCDMCQVSFCGVGIQGRCIATPLLSQHPHGMSDISDLVQSTEVYDCFDGNTVEVEIMLDYLSARRLTPRHLYREIVAYVQTQPRGFAPLIELELFVDVHGVVAGTDSDPTAPRSRICRPCATEVLLWGLRDWWVRERRKGLLDPTVLSRPDCVDGIGCQRQKDLLHAREFNHIILPLPSEPPPEPSMNSDLQSESTAMDPPPISASEHPSSIDSSPTLELEVPHTSRILSLMAAAHVDPMDASPIGNSQTEGRDGADGVSWSGRLPADVPQDGEAVTSLELESRTIVDAL
ncbi:hypothetical protein JAAARDRAFT_30440 [Jaapia argillacea MUCL 33604]|uniref:RING-type domain-containing protein n=1 Tax=Jaapia argillacea MUCL 33604 TaxID=933084 RepID=A0A067QIU5_9AGAM|nr:hypothetical protein JAAARDRAFT_30440 [Jaapia argillacea MUCL 33604]